MANPTFNTFTPRPPPQRGQQDATFISPPELQRQPYPGSPRTSDRQTIEALYGSPPPAHPGSGMPGEAWDRPKAPGVRGLPR